MISFGDIVRITFSQVWPVSYLLYYLNISYWALNVSHEVKQCNQYLFSWINLEINIFSRFLLQRSKCCFRGKKSKHQTIMTDGIVRAIVLSIHTALYCIQSWIWFCPKGSSAWWVGNQQAPLRLSLYVVRPSLMCAAVNTAGSLPTTVSWGMRLSTRTLMSTLEGSHRRKMLQL